MWDDISKNYYFVAKKISNNNMRGYSRLIEEAVSDLWEISIIRWSRSTPFSRLKTVNRQLAAVVTYSDYASYLSQLMHSLFRCQERRGCCRVTITWCKRTDWRCEREWNMSSYSSELSRSQEYLSFRSSVPLRKIVVDADGTKVSFRIAFAGL